MNKTTKTHIITTLTGLQMALFFVFWGAYTKYDKIVGVYLAVISFFFGNLFIYSSEFGAAEMTKIILVSLTSLFLFMSLKYDCITTFVNKILTWLVRLNVAIMAFADNTILLRCVLLFIAATTPYFTVNKGELHMDTSVLHKDIWVVVYTIAFLWFNHSNTVFYLSNNYWYFAMTFILPLIFHFVSNQFLEVRAMSLCVLYLVHPFFTDKAIHSIYGAITRHIG